MRFPILFEKDGTGRKLFMAGTLLDGKSQFKPEVSLFCIRQRGVESNNGSNSSCTT